MVGGVLFLGGLHDDRGDEGWWVLLGQCMSLLRPRLFLVSARGNGGDFSWTFFVVVSIYILDRRISMS